MKKPKFNFAPSIALIMLMIVSVSTSVFTSCQSAAKKEENAEKKVEKAEENLKEAQKEVVVEQQKEANAEEWKAFREATEQKIKDNDTRITELKAEMKASEKANDAAYKARIDMVEEKNKAMRNRMDNQEKMKSDWESFKREYNHDMDELGQSLKDFTVNNKK